MSIHLQSTVHHALGKIKSREVDRPRLKLSQYLDISKLPTPPATFGHEQFISGGSWGTLGNDSLGDCVCAGACHETMLYTATGSGQAAPFTDAAAIALYSAITGYSPNDPNSDQGTDMNAAAKYRRQTGINDASGKTHKIGAYLALTPGDLAEHLIATYIFGAVGMGIEFPAFAMDLFNAGQPWDICSENSTIEGGHYVPLVANRVNADVVTWGRIQPMTAAFFEKYNDESIVYLSTELLNGNGVTPEGLNLAALQDDLNQLTA